MYIRGVIISNKRTRNQQHEQIKQKKTSKSDDKEEAEKRRRRLRLLLPNLARDCLSFVTYYYIYMYLASVILFLILHATSFL